MRALTRVLIMAGLLGSIAPEGVGLLQMAAAAPANTGRAAPDMSEEAQQQAARDELRRIRSEASAASKAFKAGKIKKEELEERLMDYHKKAMELLNVVQPPGYTNPATEADPNYDRARRQMLRKPGG